MAADEFTMPFPGMNPYLEAPDMWPDFHQAMVGQDPDVLLDLQIAANRVYREGPYARAIDYSVEPAPPTLNEEDTTWLDERLRVAGLRR
jgi:hypothetical protein